MWNPQKRKGGLIYAKSYFAAENVLCRRKCTLPQKMYFAAIVINLGVLAAMLIAKMYFAAENVLPRNSRQTSVFAGNERQNAGEQLMYSAATYFVIVYLGVGSDLGRKRVAAEK